MKIYGVVNCLKALQTLKPWYNAVWIIRVEGFAGKLSEDYERTAPRYLNRSASRTPHPYRRRAADAQQNVAAALPTSSAVRAGGDNDAPAAPFCGAARLFRPEQNTILTSQLGMLSFRL